MNKDDLRKEILEKRNDLSKEEVVSKSDIIISKLKCSPEYKSAKVILFYVSKDNEVNTHGLIKEASADKKVLVPKVRGQDIDCCKIKSLTELSKGNYDILEPKVCELVDFETIDLVIVPGVAFDRSGNRIGFGKGYYDNLLRKVSCKKVALAYSFQIVDSIESDEWDIKVDLVISE